MKYKLIWKKAAIRDLTEIWLSSSDRNLVTATNASIENDLVIQPFSLGEWRTSSVHRVILRSPSAVEFVIVEDDKKVIVRAVWSIA